VFESARAGKIKARPGPTIDLRLILAARYRFFGLFPNLRRDDDGYPNREKVEKFHFIPETGDLKEASLGDPGSIGGTILTVEPVDCRSWRQPTANLPAKTRLSDDQWELQRKFCRRIDLHQW
jgi:hypothetical protein